MIKIFILTGLTILTISNLCCYWLWNRLNVLDWLKIVTVGPLVSKGQFISMTHHHVTEHWVKSPKCPACYLTEKKNNDMYNNPNHLLAIIHLTFIKHNDNRDIVIDVRLNQHCLISSLSPSLSHFDSNEDVKRLTQVSDLKVSPCGWTGPQSHLH